MALRLLISELVLCELPMNLNDETLYQHPHSVRCRELLTLLWKTNKTLWSIAFKGTCRSDLICKTNIVMTCHVTVANNKKLQVWAITGLRTQLLYSIISAFCCVSWHGSFLSCEIFGEIQIIAPSRRDCRGRIWNYPLLPSCPAYLYAVAVSQLYCCCELPLPPKYELDLGARKYMRQKLGPIVCSF